MNHTLTTTLALAALAGVASAQNALGGGRALDGGLSNTPGGRINATTQDLQSLVRFGTGSNPLNGPPSTIGIRNPRSNSSALSDAISRGLIRDPSLLSRVPLPDRAAGEGIDRMINLEAGRLPGGALTSSVSLPQGTSARDLSRRANTNVGYIIAEKGDLFSARSSSLRGLELFPTNRVDLSVATKPGEQRSGTAETYGKVIDELRRASLARALTRPDASAPITDPTAARGTPSAPRTGTEPLRYDPEATLQRLRARLLNTARNEAPASDAAPQVRPLGPSDAAAAATNPAAPSGASEAATEDDINTLRAMGLKLDAYVPSGAGDAAASDGYTRLGQEAMVAGKFGMAEQMFSSALVRSPSNPLAQAGKIHADMGMGLMMTSGADLRAYLVDNPEMIPVRFDPRLLVPQGRAAQLVSLLEADLNSTYGSLLPNAGLSLAYLGRQFDNPLWLSKGLEAMAIQYKHDPQGKALRDILVKVWLIDPLSPAPEMTKPPVGDDVNK